MGKLKLLTKSIVFSTRSRRRFFTFVIIFSILSGGTILLLNYFDNFSRQGLLEHKGVVIKTASMDTVFLNSATNDVPSNLDGSSTVIYYKYINFGSSFRIFSVDPRYAWAFSEIKPNNLISGSFPSGDNDIMISEDALVTLDDSEGSTNMYTKPVVGTKFKIGSSIASPFDLTVKGIYRKPASISADFGTSGREWIFLTEASFNILISGEHLGLSSSQIYVHSITIIAAGDVYSGACYDNVNSIHDTLLSINDDPDYNDMIYTPKANKEEARNMAFLSLVFGIVGTILVSTLYSYIITRFRRREVAVLKAMGYSKTDVRIVMLSEILVVAITGFVFGLLTIQGYLVLTKQGSWVFNILVSQTAFLSFIAVVLATIPGFLLISYRILSVRPIEIFRQK